MIQAACASPAEECLLHRCRTMAAVSYSTMCGTMLAVLG